MFSPVPESQPLPDMQTEPTASPSSQHPLASLQPGHTPAIHHPIKPQLPPIWEVVLVPGANVQPWSRGSLPRVCSELAGGLASARLQLVERKLNASGDPCALLSREDAGRHQEQNI